MFLDRLSGRVFYGYSYYYCLSFMGIKSGGSGRVMFGAWENSENMISSGGLLRFFWVSSLPLLYILFGFFLDSDMALMREMV